MTTAEKITKKYTYSDYLTWPDEERWEFIDGTPYNVTPAPSFRHQAVTGAFFVVLTNKLSSKGYVAVIAPTDVVLSGQDVVQPDVFVVCDKKKITENNIQGAPDLVIEVMSPSTATKDSREKKALYEKYGVREYLLVHPVEAYLERFVLNNGKYGLPEVFGAQDTLSLQSLEGIEIPLADVLA